MKRILLKLSGEALYNGSDKYDENTFLKITSTIKEIQKRGIDVAIVCGGGNIFRGKTFSKEFNIDQITGDYMGMMATIMNGLVLQSFFNSHDLKAKAFSSFPVVKVLDEYTIRDASSALDNHEVVILTGGVGSPYFTTDSGAALRALELNIDSILMGKNGVDGVLDKDPRLYSDAKLIKKTTYQEVLAKDLKVMDSTALGLLNGSDVEIRVFNMKDISNAIKIVDGSDIGTIITTK